MTCKDCLPRGNRLNTAGNTTCTAYGQKLVIEWAYPIAELYLPVAGGRTVTDNRGMQIKLKQQWPAGGLAYFPGTGITRIEITDPWINEDGEWSIWVSNFHWIPGQIYEQCNCSRAVINTPAPQSAFSPDWNGNGIPDWRMDVEVSDDDGLVLKNVRLEHRYMAEKRRQYSLHSGYA